MKKFNFCVIAIIVLLLSSTLSFAKATQDFKPIFENAATIDNTTYIDANKVLMFVTNHGNFGRDLSGVFGYDYGTWFPYSGNLDDIVYNIGGFGEKSPIYAAGLWIGGKVNNEIRLAISEFDSEYGPGPMENGTFTPDSWRYKVYKLYVDSLQSNPNDDYLNWPVDQGAPVDELGRPLMRGDQMLWSVFNDADPSKHTNNSAHTAPLGIEIQQTVWAQDEDGTDTIPPPTSFAVTQFGNTKVTVTVNIIDETAFTSNDYSIITEYDNELGQIWHLINTTNNQTVLENQTGFLGNAVIYEGMSIHVSFEPIAYWEWEGSERPITGVNWGGSTFFGGIGIGDDFFGSSLTYEDLKAVEIRWVEDGAGQSGYCYRRDLSYAYDGYHPNQNIEVWDITSNPERQLNFAFVENFRDGDDAGYNADSIWNPGEQLNQDGMSYNILGGREYFHILNSDYSPTAANQYFEDGVLFGFDCLYGCWFKQRTGNGKPVAGDILRLVPNEITDVIDTFSFNTEPFPVLTTGGDGASVYMMYKLFNKGGNQIDSCYFSLWADPDLGDAGDDFVGCDSLSDLFYCYNESNNDVQYGSSPPAVGFKFIHGPLVPAFGEEAFFDEQIIPNHKNLSMSSMSKYINGTEPTDFLQTYLYMIGYNGRENIPYVYNGDTLTYMHSGDPVTGVGDIDFTPADRRMMGTVGPFDFAPGDSQYVMIKMAVGQGTDFLSSITKLKEILNAPYRVTTDIADITPNKLPLSFSLTQNYPNPFNPSTQIKFTLPTRSDVTIEIFNVLGQKITTLVDNKLSAGEHVVEWDASEVSTGIYFYKMTTSDFVQSKKMMLLK